MESNVDADRCQFVSERQKSCRQRWTFYRCWDVNCSVWNWSWMHRGLPTREVTFLTNVIESRYMMASRPFFKLERSLVVKTNQLNGKRFASSHIHPSLSSSQSDRRHWGVTEKEDYQVRFQLTFLDWRRDRPMIILGNILVWHRGVPESSWHLALMVEEEEAVWVAV